MSVFLYFYKEFFNNRATKIFLNKTKPVLDINQILYSCQSAFDAIMNETCKSPDADTNF